MTDEGVATAIETEASVEDRRIIQDHEIRPSSRF